MVLDAAWTGILLPTFWKDLLPQTSGHSMCAPPNLLPRTLEYSKRVAKSFLTQISVHSNREPPNLLGQKSGHSKKSASELTASASKNLSCV